jgi:dTDP-glucose 4,6-dehydratase
MKVLIAGGAGFIGSAFARLVAQERPGWTLVVFDKLTYAGNLNNLQEIESRFSVVRGDIADGAAVRAALSRAAIDAVVNFAAESHVDRSIMSGLEFAVTDVIGTYVLLTEARAAGVQRYVQVSTDEVYGSIARGSWTEESPLQPNSPYSASKAGGDFQVRAAHRTHGFPGMVTRGSNTYGPYHYPEKMIPLFITNLLEGKKVPLYGNGTHRRDWLYVNDHARGILAVLEHGRPGETYNLGSAEEYENLALTELILHELGLGAEWIEYVPDRPGHDQRYALDSSKAHALGWAPVVTFPVGLRQTLQWYKDHPEWWKPLKSGEYLAYYRQQYTERSGAQSGQQATPALR